MAKSSWNTDRIIGLSAMMISILTLIIFIYQTNIMRNQSRLSVQPRLIISSNSITTDSLYTFRLNLLNKGLGPAIIESISILYKDKKLEARFDDFVAAQFPAFDDYAALVSNTYLSVGSTISAGEIQNLYAVEIPIANLEKLIKYLGIEPGEDPIEIEVVYASIYKEKWRINSTEEGHPVEL